MKLNRIQEQQLNTFYNAIIDTPMTISEVSYSLGINKVNIGIYVKILLDQDKIFFVGYRRCLISNIPDEVILSTNPSLNSTIITKLT